MIHGDCLERCRRSKERIIACRGGREIGRGLENTSTAVVMQGESRNLGGEELHTTASMIPSRAYEKRSFFMLLFLPGSEGISL